MPKLRKFLIPAEIFPLVPPSGAFFIPKKKANKKNLPPISSPSFTLRILTFDEIKGVLLSSKHSGGRYLNYKGGGKLACCSIEDKQ